MFFSRFEYRIFYVLYPFVTYLLTLPRIIRHLQHTLYGLLAIETCSVIGLCRCLWWNCNEVYVGTIVIGCAVKLISLHGECLANDVKCTYSLRPFKPNIEHIKCVIH
jgi:hypothetical protein